MTILINMLIILGVVYVTVGIAILGGMSLSGMGVKPTAKEFVKGVLTWYKYFV
jgi:hypothetical protein